MGLSVYFETYGCQMNVSDTERARKAVTEAGLSLATAPEQADVVMLNTCSVRAKAERKVLARVDELHHLRRGRGGKVGVMGCVAQLEGATLLDHARKVDIVVGTQSVTRLPEIIKAAFAEKRQMLDLGEGNARDTELSWEVPLSLRHSPAVAFVPIIEGCNKFCSYCIVPYARGRERSRPFEDIVQEVRKLHESGVKEVHLIGQNVNSYRPIASDNISNLPTGTTPFSKLLRAVAETGIRRVKFTTSFPRDFHPDIICAIEEHENLCNWVHLPVQSGSNKVLKAMRRGYTREEYLHKSEAIRKSHRRIALTTDLIVGYPGETEDNFQQTLSLFEECAFDSAYIFKYSPRPGTPAHQQNDDVPEKVKTERFTHLQDLQRKHQALSLKEQVGATLPVLIEGNSSRSNSDLTGHSTCHRVVNLPQRGSLQPGNEVRVRITAHKSNSLYGEPII